MKKIFSLALILVMSMVVLTGCGNNQQGKTDKKIIVGLDDNFPPMGFIGDNNEIIGFDIDLAKEASKRLGREVEFRPIDWSSKEVELSSGRIDILWNGLDITEKRKETHPARRFIYPRSHTSLPGFYRNAGVLIS